MTQWSDEPPGGGQPGPPPGRYSPPAGQYGSPPPVQYPPAGQYGPQPGAYRPPYSPYGAKPPRETGALVVCIVLLVLALIGAFVASAAVYGNLTNDSSASPPVQGSYAPDGSVGGGSNVGGSSSGGGTSSPTPDPDAQAERLIRNFPLYHGARRVASSKRYLPPGAFTSKYGKKYVVQRSANTVYNWYRAHLGRDHLEYSGGAASTITDRDTGKVLDAYGSLTSPLTPSFNGNFNIEQGRRRGTCVLTATLYG